MATLSKLVIPIEADSTRLGKGLDDAVRRVNGFERAISSVSGRLAAFAAATFTVSKAVSIFTNAAQAMDELSKASSRLGIAVDQLQAFHFAADLAGVSAEDFDRNVTMMGKNIALAAANGGKVADVLKNLGLDADELAGMSLDQQFLAVAEAISEIDDAGTRAAVAMAIFGKGGIDMINAMTDIDQAVKDAKAELDRWGVALDGQDVKAVEAMNDAWTRVTTIVAGFAQKLIAEVAPTIETMLELTMELLAPIDGVSTGWEEVGLWVQFAAKEIYRLEKIVVGIYRIIDSLNDAMWLGLEGGMLGFSRAWKLAWGESTAEIDAQIQDLHREMVEAERQFARGVDDVRSGFDGRSSDEFDKQLEENRRAAEDAANSMVSGAQEAGDILEKSAGRAAKELRPAALERGTAAAYSATVAAGGGANLSSIANSGKLTVTALNKQTRLLEQIARNGGGQLRPAPI